MWTKSLGQHCVAILKQYNVKVSAIDEVHTEYWEISKLPSLLNNLIMGDCRQPSVLEQVRNMLMPVNSLSHQNRLWLWSCTDFISEMPATPLLINALGRCEAWCR